MIIDPLSDRPVTCNHECQDITLACFESILCEATFKPTHSTTACEWVNLRVHTLRETLGEMQLMLSMMGCCVMGLL